MVAKCSTLRLPRHSFDKCRGERQQFFRKQVYLTQDLQVNTGDEKRRPTVGITEQVFHTSRTSTEVPGVSQYSCFRLRLWLQLCHSIAWWKASTSFWLIIGMWWPTGPNHAYLCIGSFLLTVSKYHQLFFRSACRFHKFSNGHLGKHNFHDFRENCTSALSWLSATVRRHDSRLLVCDMFCILGKPLFRLHDLVVSVAKWH